MEATANKGVDVMQIGPERFNPKDWSMVSFGKAEAETMARLIVSFCQSQGGWVPFTLDQLEQHYLHIHGKAANRESLEWNLICLINPAFEEELMAICEPTQEPSDYILTVAVDTYRVRPDFIRACCKGSAQIAID